MRAALLTNTSARPGKTLTPRGIVVHSTGTPNATARNIRNYMERAGQTSSYHIVCDWSESLVLVPCYPGACEVAHHAGPTANRNYLSVSACEHGSKDKNLQTYRRLVKLLRMLLVLWEWWPPERYLLSHAQVSRRWRETDHVDPEPWLSSFGLSWPALLSDVRGTDV